MHATTGASASARTPVVATVEMGLGHLRAAFPLAAVLGADLVAADRPPVAHGDELRLWDASRSLYERVSRGSQLPVVGAPIRSLLETLTAIAPLHPYRDQSAPTRAVRTLDRLCRSGLGKGLATDLRESGRALLTTHFIPALAAEAQGCDDVTCVVTDTDINRVWVGLRPGESRVRFLAPSQRAFRRLVAYGVPRELVQFTGFPLPPELVGGEGLGTLRRNLAARMVRLDPTGAFTSSRRHEIESVVGPLPLDRRGEPPTLVYAVGGAGAQASLVRDFLPSLAPLVRDGRLRLVLSAGLRAEVAATFRRALEGQRLEGHDGVRILLASDFAGHYDAFNAALAGADVLWTKPSELTFYGALGLPLVLSAPVGVHESYNRRWARERGAALKQRQARHAAQWLSEWLEEGLLAAAAWAGHAMMPSLGAYRIAEAVAGSAEGATSQARPA